jgi:hypothetical protein
MSQIKFSHHYVKLNKIDTSRPVMLVHLFLTNTSALSDEFLEYDTVYWEGMEKKHYPLEKGMPILFLLFVDFNGTLFSTVRRNTPEKEKYYISKIGMMFDVVFEDDEKNG